MSNWLNDSVDETRHPSLPSPPRRERGRARIGKPKKIEGRTKRRKEWIERIACPARGSGAYGMDTRGKRAGKPAFFFYLFPHHTYALVHGSTSVITLRTSTSIHMDAVRGKGWDSEVFSGHKTTGNAAKGKRRGNDSFFGDGASQASPFVLLAQLKCIRRCALLCVYAMHELVHKQKQEGHAIQQAELLQQQQRQNQSHTRIADPTPPRFHSYRQARVMSSSAATSSPPTLAGHAGREGIQVDANTILLVLDPTSLSSQSPSAWRQANALIAAWRETKKKRDRYHGQAQLVEKESVPNILYVHGCRVMGDDDMVGDRPKHYLPSLDLCVNCFASAFHTTNLDYLLRRLFSTLFHEDGPFPYKHLVIVGARADISLESTVRNAADLGYIVTYVTDAVSGTSDEREARAAYVSQKKGGKEGVDRDSRGSSCICHNSDH